MKKVPGTAWINEILDVKVKDSLTRSSAAPGMPTARPSVTKTTGEQASMFPPRNNWQRGRRRMPKVPAPGAETTAVEDLTSE